jgi:hypothetical protein
MNLYVGILTLMHSIYPLIEKEYGYFLVMIGAGGLLIMDHFELRKAADRSNQPDPSGN